MRGGSNGVEAGKNGPLISVSLSNGPELIAAQQVRTLAEEMRLVVFVRGNSRDRLVPRDPELGRDQCPRMRTTSSRPTRIEFMRDQVGRA